MLQQPPVAQVLQQPHANVPIIANQADLQRQVDAPAKDNKDQTLIMNQWFGGDDFVIDEDLKVYLMEANMSPNLSSAHFPANALLYEQVGSYLIFNHLSFFRLCTA